MPATCVFSVAMAHHGAREYDLKTVLEYEGVVLEHLWRNPHNVIVLETQSDSGEPLSSIRSETFGNQLTR